MNRLFFRLILYFFACCYCIADQENQLGLAMPDKKKSQAIQVETKAAETQTNAKDSKNTKDKKIPQMRKNANNNPILVPPPPPEQPSLLDWSNNIAGLFTPFNLFNKEELKQKTRTP